MTKRGRRCRNRIIDDGQTWTWGGGKTWQQREITPLENYDQAQRVSQQRCRVHVDRAIRPREVWITPSDEPTPSIRIQHGK
jgi:hypothetical protein